MLLQSLRTSLRIFLFVFLLDFFSIKNLSAQIKTHLSTLVTKKTLESKIHQGKIHLKWSTYLLENNISTYLPLLTQILKKHGTEVEFRAMFPKASFPKKHEDVDLRKIYEMSYRSSLPKDSILSVLHKSNWFEWLEIPNDTSIQPLFIPNDTLADLTNYTYIDGDLVNNNKRQWYLEHIRAFEAWDVSKGDSNTVIGISDTHFDYFHTDLIKQVKTNLGETGLDGFGNKKSSNNKDDDGDGLIDNVKGWDLADNDNDVRAIGCNSHGTYTSGLIAAEVNNTTGIAGTGYKCKILPIKIAQSAQGCNQLTASIQSIALMADLGVKVMSLSWGGANSNSSLLEDVINYASINKDVVIVAANGNSGINEMFYPASYDAVLSVGFVNYHGCRRTLTTVSPFLDVVAPGSNLITLSDNQGYFGFTGSSAAAPVVAGLAGLMRSKYPNLKSRQVIERIRVTSQSVDTISTACVASEGTISNVPFKEKLGKGSIDMYRALTDSIIPSIRIKDVKYAHDNAKQLYVGDTGFIKFSYTNYLKPVQNATFTLSSLDSNLIIVNSTESLPGCGTLDSIASIKGFKVYLKPNMKVNAEVLVRIGMVIRDKEGRVFEDYQYWHLSLNPENSTLDLASSNTSATFTNIGRIGYLDVIRQSGNGYKYQNQGLSQLSEGGLVVGLSPHQVSSNIRQNLTPNRISNDFISTSAIRLSTPPKSGLDYALATFKDTSNQKGMSKIIYHQNVYSSKLDTSLRGIIFYEIDIENKSNQTIDSISLGMFMDWDLFKSSIPNNYNFNFADWDTKSEIGYVYSKSQASTFGFHGLTLLTLQRPNYYAFNMDSTAGPAINPNINFTDSLKYASIQKGIQKPKAGRAGVGNDVGHILGAKIYGLAAGSSRKIAFAILSAPDLNQLKARRTKAKNYFAQLYQASIPSISGPFLCKQDSASQVIISPKSGNRFRFYQNNSYEQKLQQGSSFITGKVKIGDRFYISTVDSVAESVLSLVVVSRFDPNAGISTLPDTFKMGENLNATALQNFANENHLWTLNKQPISQAAFTNYLLSQEGSFSLVHTVKYDIFCIDSIQKNILVVRPLGLGSIGLKDSHVSIYPNPVENECTLEVGMINLKTFSCAIFDIQGKKVIDFTLNQSKTKLDLSSLAAGCYVLSFSDKSIPPVKIFKR